jgi:hypothetical protein
LIVMTTTPVVPLPREPEPEDGSPDSILVDDKAWQHLGVTGQVFRRLWYAGTYKDDPRPAVQALDRLMRTGEWRMP